jgi:hypothetical protein
MKKKPGRPVMHKNGMSTISLRCAIELKLSWKTINTSIKNKELTKCIEKIIKKHGHE